MKSLITLLLFLFALTAGAGELKILTWNVYMIPKPIKWSYQPERTIEITKQIAKSDYDIVFLQEAFMGDFRKKLYRSVSKKFPYAHYLGINGAVPLVGSGVFVLSKYPYKVLENIHFRDCSGGDCFSAKGATFIEVTLPGDEKLQFGVTHMQAGSGAEKEAVRLSQLMQIRGSFQRIKTSGIPQFLVGDVNVDYNNNRPEFDRLTSLLQMKTDRLIGDLQHTGGFPTVCYNKTINANKWIDHILVSQESRNVRVTRSVRAFSGRINGRECPLSDHHSVEATIRTRNLVSPLKLAAE